MSEEERQWVLDNVEEVCVDTNDIDEICMGLEHLTIFATENINILINNVFKLQQENKELKENIDKAIEYILNRQEVETGNYNLNGKELLKILKGDK